MGSSSSAPPATPAPSRRSTPERLTNDAFERAMHALSAGRVDDAQRQFQVLRADLTLDDRVRADAAHWDGVIHLQKQCPADALSCFDTALALMTTGSTNAPATALNRALALRALDRRDDAHDALAALLAPLAVSTPRGAALPAPYSMDVVTAAVVALASCAETTIAREQALSWVEYVLAITLPTPATSEYAVLHEWHGILLSGFERYQLAEQAFVAALASQPSLMQPGSGNNGALHRRRVSILNHLGLAVKVQGRLEDATWHFRDALRIDPDCVPVLVNLGQTVALLGDADQATAPLTRAVQLAPHFVPARQALSHALSSLGRFDEALIHAEAALVDDAHAPSVLASALSWQNLGAITFELGDIARASSAFDRALTLDPTLSLAAFNAASILLEEGAYAAGWAGYQARLRLWPSDYAPVRDLPLCQPGDDLSAATVLVHAEQGLGDTLQFFRFVRRFAPRARSVIVAVPTPLHTLLASAIDTFSGATIMLVTRDAPLPDCIIDYHCPMASLPWMLAIDTVADIDAVAPPYLTTSAIPTHSSGAVHALLPQRHNADTTRANIGRFRTWRMPGQRHANAALSSLRSPRQAIRRVGLAWSGHITPGFDKRVISLEALAPLFALSGIEWHILQTQITADDRERMANLPARVVVVDHSRALNDFADTARLIETLDDVVTIDTAVAHLCGALGHCGALLLPHAADWRWRASRADGSGLWYPALDRYRQTLREHWDDVIEQVALRLTAHR